MARRLRGTLSGGRYHVFNRALARRTAFESVQDIRYFLSLLARCVRRGDFTVLSYVVMSTHFHLLVVCLDGRLSSAMQWVESEYARYFNRTRKRDGPLWRGRFGSRLVTTLRYLCALIRYIDQNPIAAHLTTRAEDYPYGSAWHYAREDGPPWLDRAWVEGEVCRRAGTSTYDPRLYASSFAPRLTASQARWVERCGERGAAEVVESLLAMATAEVVGWMRRKALLADGTTIGHPGVDEESIRAAVREAQDTAGGASPTTQRLFKDPWMVLEVGLLRDLAASRLESIAKSRELSRNAVARAYADHVRLLRLDDAYAARAAALGTHALRTTLGDL